MPADPAGPPPPSFLLKSGERRRGIAAKTDLRSLIPASAFSSFWSGVEQDAALGAEKAVLSKGNVVERSPKGTGRFVRARIAASGRRAREGHAPDRAGIGLASDDDGTVLDGDAGLGHGMGAVGIGEDDDVENRAVRRIDGDLTVISRELRRNAEWPDLLAQPHVSIHSVGRP